MTLRRRLAGTFAATIMGPVVTVLVQFANVPVLISIWGVHLYGEWLLISAIPSYLLLTDMGFGVVAGSEMTMRVNAGDTQRAIDIYHSVLVLVLTVSVLVGVLMVGAIVFLPIHHMLHLSVMTEAEARNTLLFLCLNCLVVVQWGVITAALRSAGKYALAMFSVNCIRLVEGASALILLAWDVGPVQLSMLMLGISIIGTCWLLYLRVKLIPWLPPGISSARLECMRQFWKPAAAYMAFPVGSAISTQGMTMMIGLVLGPPSVALFNTMRTLSRLVYQATDSVKNAVWPELSAAFGQLNLELARKLHRVACQGSIFLAIVASIALAIFGERIYFIWTNSRIPMDVATFYLLLLIGLVNSLWNASSAVALAANKHQRLALIYLGCTTGSFVAALSLIRHAGLNGAGFALLGSEVAMSIFVVRMSNKLLLDSWPKFAASLVDTTQIKLLQKGISRLWN